MSGMEIDFFNFYIHSFCAICVSAYRFFGLCLSVVYAVNMN
jgi:hypothetical protein